MTKIAYRRDFINFSPFAFFFKMGNSESLDYDYNSQNLEWKAIFSPKIIDFIRRELEHQDEKRSQTVDSVPLSTLLENLISLQRCDGELHVPTDLAETFFTPIIRDVDVHFDQARNFPKYFESIRTIASKVLDREHTKRAENLEQGCTKFANISQPKKVCTSFLEDFISIALDELLPHIGLLNENEVVEHLNKLNLILMGEKRQSLAFVSSTAITTIHKFMTQLGTIDKFKVPEIQKQVIHFLYNMSNVQGSVCGCLSAFIYMMTLPDNFEISLKPLTIESQSNKQKVTTTFEMQIPGIDKTLSFSIGRNVLVLAKENKLLVFYNPEVFVFDVKTYDDSVLLDSFDFIYIVSQSADNIQVINVSELETLMKSKTAANTDENPNSSQNTLQNQAQNNIPFINLQCNVQSYQLSTFLDNTLKIVCFGNIQQNVVFVQEIENNKFLFTQFNRNFSETDKKPLNSFEWNFNYAPKHFYFGDDKFHTFDENSFDTAYMIESDSSSNKLIENCRFFNSYTFIENTQTVFYKNNLYTLSHNNECLVFIQHPVDPSMNKKPFPPHLTSIVIPTYNGVNFKESMTQMCNALTGAIDQLLQRCLETVFSVSNRHISFFVSGDSTSISLAMAIVKNVISADLINEDLKFSLIALGLKIIALNLYLYCFKFAKGMEKFTDKDKEFFSDVKKVISLAAFSPSARKSPVIIESICLVFTFSFRYLYFPRYSDFSEFISKLLDDVILRHYFFLNFSMMSLSTCPLYMFNKNMFSLFCETLQPPEITSAFSDSLEQITDELQFLTENSVKENEEFIVPFFECLIEFLSRSINNFDSVLPLTQKLAFRLMCLDTFPLICSTVVSKSIPLIKLLTEKFSTDQEFVNSDNENSKIGMCNHDVKEMVQIVESEHNYKDDVKITDVVDFTGYGSIHLEFDERCRTESGCDTLAIYDKNNKPLYQGSGDKWPATLDFMTNYLIFKFESDRSVNMWGYKITCTAKAPLESREFLPNPILFFFNLYCNILGRLTNIALQSLPLSRTETECKVILESDIIQGIDKVPVNDFPQKENKPTKSHVNRNNLSRGISRGISFDATNAGFQFPDDMKKGFLNDLISPTPMENGWAVKLLQFMYKAVKNTHHIKPTQEILNVEKYAIAALMKQLGFLNVAISFAMSLGSGDPKSQSVPPNLHTTWKTIYKLRTTLYMSYQKSKTESQAAKPLKLKDDYPAFINDVRLKCQLLLFNDPILKKRFGDSEAYDSKTIETTITELYNFITSDLRIENISRMVDIRTKRMETRICGLKSLIEIIEDRNIFKTSQLAFLDPLDRSLQLLTNTTDLKGVKAAKFEELYSKFSQLFELLIERITGDENLELHRLLFLKLIAVNISDIIQHPTLKTCFMKMADFAEHCQTSPIELYVTLSCIWRLLGIWSIEFPLPEIIQTLLRFTSLKSNDTCQHNSIMLLAVLTQSSGYEAYSFDVITNCFISTSPRVVISTLIWLSKTLVHKNSDDFTAVFRDEFYDFEGFLHFLLRGTGSALCGGACLLIPDDSIPDSHKMIAEEIIAFFRVIIKPFSVVHESVIEVFHTVFNDCSDFFGNIHELIAVFAILGKETIEFHSAGFAIHHSKDITDLARINLFEKYSSRLVILDNNGSEQIAESLSTFVPSARIASNPNDFLINADDAKLINSLQKTIIESLDEFPTTDFAVLASNFIGFLTVALQSKDNMTTFLNNVEIEQFYSCALKHTTNRKIYTIGSLIDRIGRMTTDIANVECNTNNSESDMLNYSIVFKHETPRYFIPLTYGESLPIVPRVGKNIVKSIGIKKCIFVGDRSLPNSTLFYFEIKILKHLGNNFMIGLIDERSSTESISFYGLKIKDGIQVSPYLHPKSTDPIVIEDGDVLGCGYTRNQIMFFKNGQNIKKSLPFPIIDDFVPAIITIDCVLEFEYNFGSKMFVTDIVQYSDFDIKSDCLEKTEVMVPTKTIQPPKTNSFDDPEFDEFIEKGEAVWELPKSFTNDKRSFAQPSAPQSISANPISAVFIYEKEDTFKGELFIGQPVHIARRVLYKNEANGVSFKQLSNDAQLYINKCGIIVNIVPIADQNFVMLTLELFDPYRHTKTRFQIESMFVDPIPTPFLKVIESSFKIYESEVHKFNSVNFLKRQKSRLFNASHWLYIRMSRILFLIILDYYRYTNKISELFAKQQAVDALYLAMMEVFKFAHTPKVSDKWTVIRLSDFIFGEKDHNNIFDVQYNCPCDTHSYVRFIRAIFYTVPKEMQPVIIQLFKNAIEHIKKAPNSTREKIFSSLIPNKYIVETPHPMPLADLDLTLTLPPSSTGFIPVLHPMNSTQDRTLVIADHTIKDAVSDCVVFSAKDCRIIFKNASNSEAYGLRLGILPLNDYLQEYIFMSPLGGIHILSTLLSVVLSSQFMFHDVVKMLKQEMIPSIASLMNYNNFFIDLFAFDFIAPILTTFQYEAEDITPRIEAAFQSFTSNFQTCINEWTKLAMNSQQAIVMAVFTRLLTLDAAAARITPESPPDEIGHLYDTYVNTKVAKDALVFDQMIEAISICAALGFDMPIAIRFPAFLIAESWSESIPYNIHMKSIPGVTKIESAFTQFSKGTIEFLNNDNLPPNTALKVVCGNEIFNIMPGRSCAVTPPFTASLFDIHTHSDITDIQNNSFEIIIHGYPESHEAKREKFVANYSTFVQHVHFMSQYWQVKMDESLCRIAKAIPSIYNQCPLVTDHPMFGTETILSPIPAQLLRCRLQLFKQLDHYVPNIVNIVEFGNQESLLGCIFTSCRAAISTQFKLKTVEKVVINNLSSSSCVDVHFNRFKASMFHSNPANPSGQSLLSQFVSQVPVSNLPKMKRQNAPWHVDLIGEGATDVGGPGRDLFTEACMELMHPSLGLFIANPNKRVNATNTNQELLIPNPRPLTPQTEMEYFYAGVLIAICYISKLPEPFNFARFIWNSLTNRPVMIDDIYAVDFQFHQVIKSIETCENTISTPEQFATIFPLYFEVQNSLGEMVELIPGGSTIPVTFERRNEYIQRCKNFRVKEFNTQLDQLRKGFNLFFPATAAAILAPWELELLICGDNQCPVSELKKHCTFNNDESHIEMLWSVLEEFTAEERMLFIKFGCGRMGLPPPGMSWSQKLSIQFKSFSGKPDPKKPLPTAATCSSQMTIPRYDSKEWMAKKIRTAITLGADIDQDRNANIHDLQDST
ncbi:hypothetical protein TRFO_13492 [Tritrichomonas foetus]|uniref:HECT domain-containing protein n=1 Tax=Tritrichomonas foetus TaxID=1144522 RepID=A0A1J4L218_9EUKA|nr:hypothetical protein TRFO_13492 [Tritrichomonas foetus]|eukprot:OHT16012.1 hypothetical protein TRFO_13492 [Tritrichomonas foetus]